MTPTVIPKGSLPFNTECYSLVLTSGAGRVRTAVQTSNRCAFYMLIPWLVFEAALDADTQGSP